MQGGMGGYGQQGGFGGYGQQQQNPFIGMMGSGGPGMFNNGSGGMGGFAGYSGGNPYQLQNPFMTGGFGGFGGQQPQYGGFNGGGQFGTGANMGTTGGNMPPPTNSSPLGLGAGGPNPPTGYQGGMF